VAARPVRIEMCFIFFTFVLTAGLG